MNLTVLVSSLSIGGAEQLLLDLVKNIDRKRFPVQLLFLRDTGLLGNEIMELGIPVATDIISARFDPQGIFKLAKKLAEAKTDILLLINHLNTLFYGVPAARLSGVPVCVNWENETSRKYPFHALTMQGRRMMHQWIDKVVAVANGHKEYVASVEKIPAGKIAVIHNGVDSSRFASCLTSREAKERLGIPAQSAVVSILAALRPDKNHAMFLKAAQHVLHEIPETRFLIIGDGPRRSYLMRVAHDLGIANKVHFLGFQRQLADIFAAVDVNTLSSKPQQETLSVAALEAMAAGIPIVSTDVGSMGEIVSNGENGYLVAVGAADQLAQRLVELLHDDRLRERMGEEARKSVRDRFSTHRMVAGFENLFAEMIQARR